MNSSDYLEVLEASQLPHLEEYTQFVHFTPTLKYVTKFLLTEHWVHLDQIYFQPEVGCVCLHTLFPERSRRNKHSMIGLTSFNLFPCY